MTCPKFLIRWKVIRFSSKATRFQWISRHSCQECDVWRCLVIKTFVVSCPWSSILVFPELEMDLHLLHFFGSKIAGSRIPRFAACLRVNLHLWRFFAREAKRSVSFAGWASVGFWVKSVRKINPGKDDQKATSQSHGNPIATPPKLPPE